LPDSFRPSRRTSYLIIQVLALALAPSLLCQPTEADTIELRPPVIDTVIVEINDIYTAEEADENFAQSFMNKLHIRTRDHVVWNELLFRQGESFDSATVAETIRNLRRTELFRLIETDTFRVDGKFAVRIVTWDTWTTEPTIDIGVASDGTTTFEAGLTEYNLVGTGNRVGVVYKQEIDRAGVEIGGDFRRLFHSPVDVSGTVNLFDDGNWGDWLVGKPFRAFPDHRSLLYDGEAADRRILQFVATDVNVDTIPYQRRAFINRLEGGIATIATSKRFLRIGGTGEVRREEYLQVPDTLGLVPDTVTGTIGVYVDYSVANFELVRYTNGFTEEDLDLSVGVLFSSKLAPEGFGWETTGVGPRIDFKGGTHVGSGYFRGRIEANALFNGAGLDSGRVVMTATFAQRPAKKHITVLHLTGGVLKDPPPGSEFILGFDTPPRGFPPRAFVGTRSARGTLEHTWYWLDDMFGWELFGLGFAGFLDYGGAWYDFQDVRAGGNVGAGIRLGMTAGQGAGTLRIDFAYLWGDGIPERSGGNRFAISIGPSFFY
jgi:hypothetical protein